MMRLSRCANAVASAGTRAIAPPRTRICVTAMTARRLAIRSRIVSADPRSMVSDEHRAADGHGAAALLAAGYISGYVIGRTMSASGVASARNRAMTCSPSATSPA